MSRVLIIDDEPSIVLAVTDELIFEGYAVDSAADGATVEDALDARTGLPVYSLYGPVKEPTPAMLALHFLSTETPLYISTPVPSIMR